MPLAPFLLQQVAEAGEAEKRCCLVSFLRDFWSKQLSLSLPFHGGALLIVDHDGDSGFVRPFLFYQRL
jgi:hypothetical protein